MTGSVRTEARCRVAVFDRARARVLLRRGDAGWDLPVVYSNAAWFETGHVAAGLVESFGVEVFVQRCLLGDGNERASGDRLYVGCAMAEVADRDACRWFDLADLPRLSDETSLAWPAVRAWLAGDADARDWERPGWLDDVEDFVATHRNGRPLRLRQFRTWSRSSVWRVSDPDGSCVFKASLDLYRDEGRISAALASLFPDRFPVVLARDDARRWLLMEELSGSVLPDCGTDRWHAALETVAAVQIQALDHLGDLRAAGCPDLGVARMRRLTEEFLGPNGPVRGGRVQGLDPHHTAYLLDGAEGLVRAWDVLAAFGIPDSFEHGDFRPGHVVVHDGAVRFFDMADAAIAHPFFSAVTMLDFEPLPDAVGGSAAELKAALCRSYLGPWRQRFPQADVDAAYRAARPLAVLHAALIRWYRWLPAMVPRRNWEFMVAYWLRKLTDPTFGGPGG